MTNEEFNAKRRDEAIKLLGSYYKATEYGVAHDDVVPLIELIEAYRS